MHALRTTGAFALLVMVGLVTACTPAATRAHAGASQMSEKITPLPEQANYQRFIVKYRAGTGPAQDQTLVPARLAGAAAQLGATDAPVLRWERRLGVGADVFVSTPALDRARAQALLEALAADPEVQYVEVDAMMQIAPVPGVLE